MPQPCSICHFAFAASAVDVIGFVLTHSALVLLCGFWAFGGF